MRFSAAKNKKSQKLLKRKENLNKAFVWTDEAIQKLIDLNEDFEKLQIKLEKQMRSAYELFTNLEKSGMHFLHGFMVIGQIDFEKSILEELYNIEKPSREEKKIIDKWEDLQYYSSDIMDAWQLVFDSVTADLLPLSKIRLTLKRDFWLSDHQTIELYSFLKNLIDGETVFSYEDFAEITIKDFKPNIQVILNYNVSELEGHPTSIHHWDYQNSVGSILHDRKFILNDTFAWNEKNIQKIMEVNNWIWKRHAELKHYITELNSAFNIFSQTDPDFKNYTIEGQIEYHGSEANDIATLELQKEMSRYAAFHYWTLGVDNDRPELSDSIHEDDKLNWNFEVYSHHLSEEQKKVKFHYFMHTIFVDDCIYSFEDLVRMHEEDFKVCLEINWWPD